MGFFLFTLTMIALTLFSTTKESRAIALQEGYAKGVHKWWRFAGLTSIAIMLSFVFWR